MQLRAWRARVQPAKVGLPFGRGSRRAQGLRREQVARLAGVSPGYVKHSGKAVRTRARQGDVALFMTSNRCAARLVSWIVAAMRPGCLLVVRARHMNDVIAHPRGRAMTRSRVGRTRKRTCAGLGKRATGRDTSGATNATLAPVTPDTTRPTTARATRKPIEGNDRHRAETDDLNTPARLGAATAKRPVEHVGADQGEGTPEGGLLRRAAGRTQHWPASPGRRRRPTGRPRRTTAIPRSLRRSRRPAARPARDGGGASSAGPGPGQADRAGTGCGQPE
jgi:hypothetical protein